MSKRAGPTDIDTPATCKRRKAQNKAGQDTKIVINTGASTALPPSKVGTAGGAGEAGEWCAICEKNVPFNMMQVHVAGRRHRKRERSRGFAAAKGGGKREASASTGATVATADAATAAAGSGSTFTMSSMSSSPVANEKAANKVGNSGNAPCMREPTATCTTSASEHAGPTSRRPSPAICDTSSRTKHRMTHKPMPLARRRLTERVMEGFAVGNTAARPLLPCATKSSPLKAVLRLLFLGVGDVRNTLLTLRTMGNDTAAEAGAPCKAETQQEVHLHLNDICVPTLARAAVLLVPVA